MIYQLTHKNQKKDVMKCMNFETSAKIKTAVIVDNSVTKNNSIYKDPIGQINMKQVSAYI
jgi:hypothetical protein